MSEIVIEAGAGGEDAADFARMLRAMYDAWDGPLHHEPGKHRLVRYSPFDAEHRRHTSFAQVAVDGRCDEGVRRSYILHPYTRAIDHVTERQTDDAAAVLAGDLSFAYDGDDGVTATLPIPPPPDVVRPVASWTPEERAEAERIGRQLLELMGESGGSDASGQGTA